MDYYAVLPRSSQIVHRPFLRKLRTDAGDRGIVTNYMRFGSPQVRWRRGKLIRNTTRRTFNKSAEQRLPETSEFEFPHRPIYGPSCVSVELPLPKNRDELSGKERRLVQRV